MFIKYLEVNDYNDNLLSYNSIIELNIIKLIKKNNDKYKYLPKIYNINSGENYYEIEELDFDKQINDKQKFLENIDNGIKSLNKLNVIYIDLHKENIGYSNKDKIWKIVDFNMSGICTPNKKSWMMEPPNGTIYNKIKNLIGNSLLTNYDIISYLLFESSIISS